MNFLVVIVATYASIVEYDFTTSFGQVIIDNSGEENYGVLGETLLEDTSDPILTDRGAYFYEEDYISMPPNALLPLQDLGLTNFYGVFFIKLTASGTIFSISLSSSIEFKIVHETPNILTLTQNSGITSNSIETYLSLSNLYLGTWKAVHFKLSFLSVGGCTSLGLSINVDTVASYLLGSQLSASNTYDAVLGGFLGSGGFQGFISEFYLFSPSECTLASTTKDSAIFPSDENEVYLSSEGVSCDCGSYSCTGTTPTCIECDDSCELYCEDQSTCIDIVEICKPYAIVDGICDTSVYYIDNCKTQQSSTVCLVCDDGYNLSGDQTTCCQDGYYYIPNEICGICNSDCATCFGSDSNSCSSCSDSNKELSGNACICIYGTENGGNCISCYSECTGCSASNFCNGCSDSNAEVNVSGRCECKSEYYGELSSGQTCSVCDTSCSACSAGGSNSCLACSDSNSVLDSGSCTCASGYFLDSNTNLCQACYSDCSECSTSLSNGCLSCKDANSHLLSSPSTCICKDGYTSSTSNPITCVGCHSTCSACSGTLSNQCTACKDINSALSSNSCICNSGFYYNSLWECSNCFIDCSKCDSSGEYDCVECIDESAVLANAPGKCECKAGFIASSTNPLVCTPCHSDCKTCDGASLNDCLSCFDENSSLINGACACNSGYIAINLNTLKCTPCHEDCIECTGSSSKDCLSCKAENTYLKNSACECKPGFTSVTSNPLLCSPCSTPCETCFGLDEYSCLTCNDSNSVLINNTCSCISGFYLNSTQLKCEACSAGCSKCNNNTLCLECDSLYYIEENSQCSLCHSDCKTCNGRSNYNCFTCLDSSITPSTEPGACKCAEGEYLYKKSPLKCLKCTNNCLSCNETDCLQCFEGFSMLDSKCIRNILTLNIQVQKGTLLLFMFSEDLKADLTPKNFTAYLDLQIISYSILKINHSVYQIDLKNISITNTQLKIVFKFNKGIVSVNNSLLKDQEYYCYVEVKEVNQSYIPQGLELFTTILGNSIVFASLLSIVFNQNQGSIMISLNTIQILSYIPLFNIKIPVFLKLFLVGVRPLSIFPNFWYLFKSQLCETPEILTQFYDYGFTCKNFLFNIGELILLFAIGIFLLFLLTGCYILTCRSFKAYLLTKIMCFKYSYFIRFWLQSYIDLGIATVISIKFVKFT